MNKPRSKAPHWGLFCRDCQTALVPDGTQWACPGGHLIPSSHGVATFISANLQRQYDAFLQPYTRIRALEGRCESPEEYLLRLPYPQPSHPLSKQWGIRARSYEALKKRVISKLPKGSNILDLGAGNGWLSARLQNNGMNPLAIDISGDPQDGLAAAQHFPTIPDLALASFDDLPVRSNCADVVIFNASFHYSNDGHTVLREACRVLRPGGQIIIMDSPLYRDANSGYRMIEEQHAYFLKKFGDASCTLDRVGFITIPRLQAWSASLKLKWHTKNVSYGWAWAVRPWIARLKGQREPARFTLLCGELPR